MNEEAIVKMQDTMQRKDKLGLTLCWRCKNAGRVGCEWFKNDLPVPGWKAEPTPYVATYKCGSFYKKVTTTTYVVKACPKFERFERETQ